MKKAALAILFFCAVASANTDPTVGVKMLKEELLKSGEPKIDGTSVVAGKKVPALFFGKSRVNLNNKIVDMVKDKHGCSATVFVKEGEEFIRVSTNVPDPEKKGARAVGTQLARNDAYTSIMKGQTYCGEVQILGSPYNTCYEPIMDGTNTVGIYYFGCKK